MRSCRNSTGPLEHILMSNARTIAKLNENGDEMKMHRMSSPRFQRGIGTRSTVSLFLAPTCGLITGTIFHLPPLVAASYLSWFEGLTLADNLRVICQFLRFCHSSL